MIKPFHDSRREPFNPRKCLNFLDTCAFDPKYSPEDEAAAQIRVFAKNHQINLLLSHSNQKEIDHPNTPSDVKNDAASMIHTVPTSLTQSEQEKLAKIHAILIGNGKHKNHLADATHVFKASGGCFITTDERILGKKVDLKRVCRVVILKPSDWLKAFRETHTLSR
jgi:hypothetical protein